MILPGPIVVIEDDQDDQQILEVVFDELQYFDILFFSDAEKALHYLTTTVIKPFLIFSDINMPKLNGLQLRARLVSEQNPLLTAPYLFLTTSTDKKNIIEAYSHAAQGYFIKPTSYPEFKEMIKSIVEYWKKCEPPLLIL